MRGLLPLVVLAVAAAAAAGACGDDDDAPAPTNTSSPAATAPAPTVTATAGTTPGNSEVAQTLAQSPQYLLYTVRAGDTLVSVAKAFSGVPGGGPAGFADLIRDENKLTSATLAPGQQIAIPLVLTGDLSMMPEASFEAALGVGGSGSKIVLLQPSLAMREGYIGRLLLHSVELASGSTPGAHGFILEYWLADRPPTKGGDLDPDARVSEPAFRVAAGALAPAGPADAASFVRERDGVRYVVTALRGAQRTPKELAEMLETAAER